MVYRLWFSSFGTTLQVGGQMAQVGGQSIAYVAKKQYLCTRFENKPKPPLNHPEPSSNLPRSHYVRTTDILISNY